MTSRNGYFPGKKKATGSAIITPRTAQETQIAAMPRQSRAARQALAKTPPLRVGGDGLVEGADRIMRTPAEHQAAGVAYPNGPTRKGTMQITDEEADPTNDEAGDMVDDFEDDALPTHCSRVVLRRLVDAITASIEASGIEPDPALAAALDVAISELEWTA